MTLNTLKAKLVSLTTNCYHYTSPVRCACPYIVWAEDTRNDLYADNMHVECGVEGTIDLFSKTENDPLIASIEAALNDLRIGWYLETVIYEEDTGIIHHEWVFRFHGNS